MPLVTPPNGHLALATTPVLATPENVPAPAFSFRQLLRKHERLLFLLGIAVGCVGSGAAVYLFLVYRSLR